MKYIWQVKYEISPTLKKTEVIDNITFKVVEDKTFIDVEHITNNYDDITNTVCKNYISKLREYMLRRMLYQKSYEPISIKISSSPVLTNRVELEKEGVKLTRLIESDYCYQNSILDVNDSLKESEQFWKKGFTGRSANFNDEILRIAGWLEKSEAEADHIQQFIMTWIAFNSLYGLYSKKYKKDILKFSDTINTLLSKDKAISILKRHKNTITLLSTLNLELTNGTKCSDKLKAKLPNVSKKHLSKIIAATKCIYCVRNMCFHEGPQATNIHEYVKDIREILLSIVASCVRNFVNNSFVNGNSQH